MSCEMQNKYLKYKSKYNQLKQHGGKLSNVEVIGLCELFDKTLNLYKLFRFRYDNTPTVLNISDLNDKVYKNKEDHEVKAEYNKLYLPNLLSMSTLPHLESVAFTLRQDTTKLILNIFLLSGASVDKIKVYMTFIEKHNLKKDPVFAEIYDKCTQLAGLVSQGDVVFKETPGLKGVDLIRQISNKIINLIGNDFDVSLQNFKTSSPNNMDLKLRQQLNDLFKECFDLIAASL